MMFYPLFAYKVLINRLVLSTKESLHQQHRHKTSVFPAISPSFLYIIDYIKFIVFLFNIAFDISSCASSPKRFTEITLSFTSGSHEIALLVAQEIMSLFAQEITSPFARESTSLFAQETASLLDSHGKPRLYSHERTRLYSLGDHVFIVRCLDAGACLAKPLIAQQTVSPF
jgi:hypothetical protein